MLAIESLDPAEQFIIYAARVHRALKRRTAPLRLCLCRSFEVVGLRNALTPFIHFQNTLAVDPARSFVAGERAARIVETGELHLLEAIWRWQQDPGAEAEDALRFVTTPSVRRAAAPIGRLFAIELAVVGLFVHSNRCEDDLPPVLAKSRTH